MHPERLLTPARRQTSYLVLQKYLYFAREVNKFCREVDLLLHRHYTEIMNATLQHKIISLMGLVQTPVWSLESNCRDYPQGHLV